MKIMTIGFTQKTAEEFFMLLSSHQVDLLIDVRLNNKSQLAGFAKQPDLAYFLKTICGIEYVHDLLLAPTEQLLKRYRAKETTWEQYEEEFEAIMRDREIDIHIADRYAGDSERTVCLLCSEPTAEQCHRRLAADHFAEIFQAEVVHL